MGGKKIWIVLYLCCLYPTAQSRQGAGWVLLQCPSSCMLMHCATAGLSCALRQTSWHCRDALAEYLFNAMVKSKTQYKHQPSVPCSLLPRAKGHFTVLGTKVKAVPCSMTGQGWRWILKSALLLGSPLMTKNLSTRLWGKARGIFWGTVEGR